MASNQAVMTVLQHSDPAVFNSLDNPTNIVPEERTLSIYRKNFEIAMKERSFSVIRVPIK